MSKLSLTLSRQICESFLSTKQWVQICCLQAETLCLDPVMPNYSEALLVLSRVLPVIPPIYLRQDLPYNLQENAEPFMSEWRSSREPTIPTLARRSSKDKSNFEISSKEALLPPRRDFLNKSFADTDIPTFLEENIENKVKTDEDLSQGITDFRFSELQGDKDLFARIADSCDPLTNPRSCKPLLLSRPDSLVRKDSIQIESELPEISVIRTANCQFEEELNAYSVCSDLFPLYIMGKLAIKYNINVSLGIQLLSDLLMLNSYRKTETLESQSKAKYWIAKALFSRELQHEARNILEKIDSQLVEVCPPLYSKIIEFKQVCSTFLL